MLSRDVRKGLTKAEFNKENANILLGEVAVIAVVLGLFSGSWWVFGVTFLGLIVALCIPTIAIALIIAFSLGWAVIGYAIGSLFDSAAASIVLSIIGFVVGLGTHISALEWTQDVRS